MMFCLISTLPMPPQLIRAGGRYFNLGGFKSEIGALLVNNEVLRKSEQSFTNTNSYLQKHLIFGKVVNLLFRSDISKTF